MIQEQMKILIRMSPLSSRVLLLALLLPLNHCKKNGTEPTPTHEHTPSGQLVAPAPIITEKENSQILFSFFDSRAHLKTVQRLSRVPASAKADVLITQLNRPAVGDEVYVVNLTEKNNKGQFKVSLDTKAAWLKRNRPKASQLKEATVRRMKDSEKPKKRRQRIAALRKRTGQKAAGQPPEKMTISQAAKQASVRSKKVIMFSTSWCPSCKVARQFFNRNGVPLLEFDVEKDQTAAAQYVAIQRAEGMKEGAVPLIIVGNQVILGFAQQRIAAALRTLYGQ